MGRRRNSPADDFIELVAMLPWWGGVVLAVLSYLVLNAIASQPVPNLQPGQAGQFLGRTMTATLAGAGKYFVPFLCLLAALVSYIGRKRREKLLGDATGASGTDAVNGMTWREFELLVGEAFRQKGYEVRELGGAGADGGVDLELRRGRELSLVQCKQWRARQVGVQVVRELYGVMAARGAAEGFVVTSGSFTADAKAFAEGRNVRLVGGADFHRLLHAGKPAPVRASAPAPVPESKAPACPKCNAAMVRRTAKQGTRAGSDFWGCSRFPQCRGTQTI